MPGNMILYTRQKAFPPVSIYSYRGYFGIELIRVALGLARALARAKVAS